MTDYISREAAIAYIREQSEEMQKAFEELGGESGIYADAYNDLEEDFYRIPAADVEPVHRWIPCSERLPEAGKRVLATDGGFVGEMYIGKRGDWRRYNVTYIQDLMALDILWWMPLPEPPEEGGEESE